MDVFLVQEPYFMGRKRKRQAAGDHPPHLAIFLETDDS
jgi:hypothetical protein